MSDMSVNFGGGMIRLPSGIDAEWQAIIRKLKAYGKSSSGNKARDKELLNSIELDKVKQENIPSSKFLTISKSEQEKILEKKNDKKADANPELYQNTQKGAQILGEQVYLAIQMKNKKKKS